jgi:hypothetical protein
MIGGPRNGVSGRRSGAGKRSSESSASVWPRSNRRGLRDCWKRSPRGDVPGTSTSYIAELRSRLRELEAADHDRITAWCDWAEDWRRRADPTLRLPLVLGLRQEELPSWRLPAKFSHWTAATFRPSFFAYQAVYQPRPRTGFRPIL